MDDISSLKGYGCAVIGQEVLVLERDLIKPGFFSANNCWLENRKPRQITPEMLVVDFTTRTTKSGELIADVYTFQRGLQRHGERMRKGVFIATLSIYGEGSELPINEFAIHTENGQTGVDPFNPQAVAFIDFLQEHGITWIAIGRNGHNPLTQEAAESLYRKMHEQGTGEKYFMRNGTDNEGKPTYIGVHPTIKREVERINAWHEAGKRFNDLEAREISIIEILERIEQAHRESAEQDPRFRF